MGKGGKHLQNTNQEIKKLQDSLHDFQNWVIDFPFLLNTFLLIRSKTNLFLIKIGFLFVHLHIRINLHFHLG
jgi:hypothetical protein